MPTANLAGSFAEGSEPHRGTRYVVIAAEKVDSVAEAGSPVEIPVKIQSLGSGQIAPRAVNSFAPVALSIPGLALGDLILVVIDTQDLWDSHSHQAVDQRKAL